MTLTRRANALLTGALVFAGACSGPDPAPSAGTERDLTPAEDGNFTQRVYERNFVFASLNGDSVFLVPWLMRTVEYPDTVMREARAWLAHGGVWEPFFDERWWTPPSRTAGRILPHEGLRLLVRDGDAVDGIMFEEGPRSLELALGDVQASWTGARGGSFVVVTGAAYLADQRVDGMILDMARGSAGTGPPGGDWAFLLSGDSARFVLAADDGYDGESDPIYRGWADFEGRALQWPEVRVDWRRAEAFPPARRDVPVAWRLWSADGLVEGELEAVSADIQAGEGPGPLLPVRALYEVVGEVSTVEGTYPVRGILVHEIR